MSEWKDMHTCPRMEQHTGKISKWNNWMLKSKRQYNWMFNRPSNTKQKKRGLPIYEGDGKCNQRRSRLSIHLHGGLPFLHHKQTFLARFYCLQQSREGQASLTYAYVNYIWYLRWLGCEWINEQWIDGSDWARWQQISWEFFFAINGQTSTSPAPQLLSWVSKRN